MEVFNQKLTTKYYFDNGQLTGEECRICLKKCTNIWQVFHSDGEIPSKMMACAAVQVQEGDGLPHVICQNCRELLDVSYNFKCQVENSDSKFREILKLKETMFQEAIAHPTDSQLISKDLNHTLLDHSHTTTEFITNTLDTNPMIFQEPSNESQAKGLEMPSYVESSAILAECGIDPGQLEKNHDQNQLNIEEKPCYLVLTSTKPEDKTESQNETEDDDEEDDDDDDDIHDYELQKNEEDEIIHDKSDKNDENVNEKYDNFVCYMCEKEFDDLNKLENHVSNNHNSLKNNEQELETDDCDKEMDKDEKIDSKQKKKKIKFSCKYCTKQFAYEKSFLTHAKRHPEYKDQVIASRMRREYEERGGHDSEDDDMPQEGLQCTQCGKLFATKRNLKRHISTHSGVKFNCPTCNKEFSRADKLKEHEQSKHKDEFFLMSDEDSDDENKEDNLEKKDKSKRRHQCPMCPKRFARDQTLENHIERHKKVKQKPIKKYLCDICSKCFAQSGSLVAHMRTHTGVKPYVCNVCNRAFTKSTYLQLHLRTHSGEKPYICQYCSRAFARANTLARHITMHTGEAKYHCQICTKSFRRLTSLNEHTYTHTGQRPYACKICSKRYNNAGSLYAHTKKCKLQQMNNQVVDGFGSVDNVCQAEPPVMIFSEKKCEDVEQQQQQQQQLPQFVMAHVPTTTVEDDGIYGKKLQGFHYGAFANL